MTCRSRDPRRYHYLEQPAPPWLEQFIDEASEDVLVQLVGCADVMPDCLTAAITWCKRLEGAGIVVRQEGQGVDNLTWRQRGGYRVAGETSPRDHHFLVVGEEMVLFDPTWRQFEKHGPPTLDTYDMSDGRTFAAWRKATTR